VVQAEFDRQQPPTGIEVTDVAITMARPPGKAAADFEDLMMARQDMEKDIADADRTEATGMTTLIGKLEMADTILAQIDQYRALRTEHGADGSETIEQRDEVVRILRAAGGSAGQIIDISESERWIRIMETMAQNNRIRGELSAFRAAPELYKQRATMSVLATLAGNRKYYLFDPSRFDVFVEFKDLNLQQQFFQPGQAEGTASEGGS
jgi:hypothetical protein